ncbi:hypothetical protein FBEOM_13022 [Fusarium beomiforme]|uniref:Uncharacterized protein n=1 Tax=Fusarium beomiforme TaxID=44412 RepID=A0A9P5DRZ6_9HYPO|nr:hypothetical protein FBEOM_13022 [Fusarium beomiforme]
MARNSSDDAEVLVHITAPSRSTDDVFYRQLAQAYRDFQPQKRTQLSLVASQASKEERRAPEGNQGAPSPSQTRVATSFGQSFEITSQDLSFEGAIDNRSSPCLPRQSLARGSIPSSDDAGFGSTNSWCAPPSQISDSYPMPDAALLNISPSRILQSYIGKTQSSQAYISSSSPLAHKRRPPVPELGHRVDIPSSLLAPNQEESLPLEVPGFIESVNVVPMTPQAVKSAEFPIPSSNTEAIAFKYLALDVTHISGSAASSHSPAQSSRAGSEPPSSKRFKTAHLEHGDLVRSFSDTGPASSTRNSQVDHVSSSLEIRPPSPSVGVDDIDPADLISEKLAKLSHDLSSRYRPTTKRDLDPFERGYWLLDCSNWSPTVRFDTWVFLGNYLKSGLAGWGTWCRRDNSHDWIRLYCWGHVAKHTYLLLYLASGRQVKTSGAKWYGADGEVALEIPPY